MNKTIVAVLLAALAAFSGTAEARAKPRHGQPTSITAVCPKGSGYPDGCLAAPNATNPFPTILATYATRPPWNVAGVDPGYGIGPATGTAFKTPGVDACPASTSCNATTHQFTLSGANILINGWDFTLNGGWQVVCGAGCSNPTITNNKFLAGANAYPALNVTSSASGGGTFSNNTVDGNFTNLSGLDGLLNISTGGAWTVRYNLLKNAFTDVVQFSCNSASASLTEQYNVIQNSGAGIASGTHPDWLQMFGSCTYNPVTVTYNTVIMNRNGIDATQGFSCQDNTFPPTCNNVVFDNNTLVLAATPTTGGVSYAFIFETSELASTGEIKNNYIDPTDIAFGVWLIRNTGIGPYNGTVTTSGNVNMKTGASIP